MHLVTIERACEVAGNYSRKRLIDELVIVRRETETGEDIFTRSTSGKVRPNIDDAVGVHRYVDLRNAGYPVKLAGINATRLRTAMREYPEADQLTTVTLDNGFVFTLPSASLDLASGFNSGRYVVSATMVDVRNLRDRVRRAIETYGPGIEVEDGDA